MLIALPLLASAWGPVLHQAIAEQFAADHFSNLTAPQRDAFVLGSIWADGLDKRATHDAARVAGAIRQIGDADSDLCWFFIGIFCHIAVDTSAHAGRPTSFIASRGLRHSLSELVVDSVLMHERGVAPRPFPRALLRGAATLNVRASLSFYPLYRLLVLFSKSPAHRCLRWIERDGLPRASHSQARRNFAPHYEAMLLAMRVAIERLAEHGLDDARLRELSARLVYAVRERAPPRAFPC